MARALQECRQHLRADQEPVGGGGQHHAVHPAAGDGRRWSSPAPMPSRKGTVSTGAIIASGHAVGPGGGAARADRHDAVAVPPGDAVAEGARTRSWRSPRTVRTRSASSTGPIRSGAMTFRNVGFAYPGTDTEVLTGLNFSVKPGERIGDHRQDRLGQDDDRPSDRPPVPADVRRVPDRRHRCQAIPPVRGPRGRRDRRAGRRPVLRDHQGKPADGAGPRPPTRRSSTPRRRRASTNSSPAIRAAMT